MPRRTTTDDHFWAERVVVITGASAGVGRATANRFAKSGVSIGILARDAVSLHEAKSELEGLGARVIALEVDVANGDMVFEAAQRIEARLGPIGAWINNAMVTVFAPVQEMTPVEYRRVTEVTYLGVVHGTMAALRHMKPRNRGVIIQVGSALAYRGIPLQSAYCGAKHAIRGFTDSLRTELLHEKTAIDLVMVQLPAVNTPQFAWARTHMTHEPRPVPPVFQPEVAAEAIFQAARRPRREMWLGLSTAKAIFGNMLVPGIADSYLAGGGYTAQETSRPVSPDRQDNLFAPASNFHRARGPFKEEASSSAVLVAGPSARLGAIILGLILAIGVGVAATWSLL
jgi:short-subunit dehydrogenase